MTFYRLQNDVPVPEDDPKAWVTWFAETSNRLVEITQICRWQVVTMFWGLDVGAAGYFHEVFWDSALYAPGGTIQQTIRSRSLAEAKVVHASMVSKVKEWTK